MNKSIVFISVLCFSVFSLVLISWNSTSNGMIEYPIGKSNIEDTLTPVVHTDKVWSEILDSKSFDILIRKGTEPSTSGIYNKHNKIGSYHCKACQLPLFKSVDKYDSGTGWPSYSNYIHNHVEHVFDGSHGWNRTEVVCNRCKSHLGHVFDDGPKPTGLRYCINSLCLEFESN